MKRTITFRIDERLYNLAKSKSQALNTTMTALLEEGLAIVLGEKIPIGQHPLVPSEVDKAYIQDVISEYLQEYIQPQLEDLYRRVEQANQEIQRQSVIKKEPSPPPINSDRLQEMTRDELRRYAHSLGIPMTSKKRKPQLINEIIALEA